MKKRTIALFSLALIFASALIQPAHAQGADGWQRVAEGEWAFYEQRSAVTGWRKIEGSWYYFKANGNMATGWQSIGDKWYYFGADGAMATGWLREGSLWYYLSSNGAMHVGWVKSGGQWYYMRSNGSMATGWVRSGSDWFYMSDSGEQCTGWLDKGGQKYYLYPDGRMATGMVNIDGQQHEFNANGELMPDPQATPQPTDPAETHSPFVPYAIELRVFELVNEERAKEGLPPYEYHLKMGEIARFKSEDMGLNNYFDHTSPIHGGQRELFQMFSQGYSARGENIARGYTTAERVMTGWMGSTPHRANILDNRFTHIGVGYYVTAAGTAYWTQTFYRE